MKFLVIFFLPILFGASLSEDTSPQERKSNIVVKQLNLILEKLIDELKTNNATIPLVDLGENGKFENVILNVQKMTKWTDGVGSLGFQLRTNLSDIRMTGYYDIKDLEIPGLFPVFGEGDFLITVEGVMLRLEVKNWYNYKTKNMEFLVPDFDVQVVNSKVKFDNLMGDPNVSDFLGELISNLIPRLMQALRPSLTNLLQLLLNKYGNGIIDCIKGPLEDFDDCVKNLFETIANVSPRLSQR